MNNRILTSPRSNNKSRLQSQVYKIAYGYLTDMLPEHLKKSWEQYFSPTCRYYIPKNFYINVGMDRGPLRKIGV